MSQLEPTILLIDEPSSGEQIAAEGIYLRYAERLCALAESHIHQRLKRRIGSDDIVQSVFRTFFRRASLGEFSVNHSGSLWRLLVQITLHKVCKQVEYHQAEKRSVDSEAADGGEDWRLRMVASDPSPAEAAALTDELDHLLSQLTEQESQILQLCLQGYLTPEIAEQVDCSRWTVRRALDRAGHLLQQRLRPEN